MYVTDRIQELKTFSVDRMDLNEMIYLEADALHLRLAYEHRAIPVPEWLTDKIRELNTEIDRRKRDDLEKRLKELRAADAADMTASERREARKKEREAIEAALAPAPAGTTA